MPQGCVPDGYVVCQADSFLFQEINPIPLPNNTNKKEPKLKRLEDFGFAADEMPLQGVEFIDQGQNDSRH